MMHRLVVGGLVTLAMLDAASAPLFGQTCGGCPGASLPAFVCPITGSTLHTGTGCVGLNNCQPPTVSTSQIEVVSLGSGNFEAHLRLSVQAPWNSDAGTDPNSRLKLFWSSGPPMEPSSSLCQFDTADKADTYLSFPITCAQAPKNLGTYSLRAVACFGGGSCEKVKDAANLSFMVTKSMLGCPGPPKHGCNGDANCKECRSAGSGGASYGGGGGGAAPPGSGPKALLFYLAGGAGGPGWPGTGPTGWNQRLGRYWSHDHAERIVTDPDITHVWLITKYATFREFTGLAGAGPRLRPYPVTSNSPSDEKRQLFYDDPAAGGTGGWQLKDLDGTVEYFLASGPWDKTVGRNPTNIVQGTYSSGALSSVSFPDGRSETYTYDSSTGKLASITEVGVAGGASRTWIYQWTGDDLLRIARPDGTLYEFFYSSDPNFPGYLTRMDLVESVGGARRVDAAWSYDSSGNVAQLWRGDPVATGPGAIERSTFAYDNTPRPTQTTVTDAFGMPAVYSVARDTVSQKPKVTQAQGDCPACGVGPNAVLQYNDPANPLLPTTMIDGRGLRTDYTYNADGQMTARSEAVGTALARDMTYQYDATFRSFPTLLDQPSTSGGAARRQTVKVYDTQGNLTTSTITGAEGGSAFSYPTAMTYNAGGRPLSVDPPGYGTGDLTSFTYDPARGNGSLVQLTRTDPLVGTTRYGNDPFNRRTSVTDVNGVQTMRTYDALDRVTSVVQKGATSAADLTTAYSYNAFGDLFQMTLPAGNVVEYGYDPMGRLVTVERKPAAATPGERTLYTLDAVGHRTREELQHWTGAAWATDGETDYVYSTRCHLDKVSRPDGSPTGSVTEYAYDCDDNLAKLWDANHPSNNQVNPATQVYSYDELNRVKTVQQPWAGTGGGTATTAYAYDVQDHLTAVTDANGNLTSYIYGDRDLQTREASPVSGQTDTGYNAHGEMVTQIDARNVTTSRTVDALDRATAVTYPDSSLSVGLTYDAPGSFAKGRLTGITRHGQTLAYTYDRFGRTTQDGGLTYGYDKNGNRTTIGYPAGVSAAYTFDFADREKTLSLLVGANPPLPLAGPATYQPFGPLTMLPLGNGLTETRTYDARYLPQTIGLAGGSTLLNWSYTLDPVGDITAITDALNAANNRTYGYLDVNYFLTQGNGPWGTRAWTYDRIGNRLTETRSGVTDTYNYLTSAGAATAKLGSIALGAGGMRTYSYDAAGDTIQIADPAQQLDLTYDAAGKLSRLRSIPSRAETALAYDGRGFLEDAHQDPAACLPTLTQPVYSSQGRLEARAHFNLLQPAATATDSSYVLYFAGRPLATYGVTGHTSTLLFLTTDHLGTPAVATRDTGAPVWQGGFEAFGADWSGAGPVGVFLRLPGQWEDPSWSPTARAGFALNLNRWYDAGTGRYDHSDPIGLKGGVNLYSYALSRPLYFVDPLGLACSKKCPDCPRGTWGCLGASANAFGIGGVLGGGTTLLDCKCLSGSGKCSFLTLGGKGGVGISASVNATGCFIFGAHCVDDILGLFGGGDLAVGLGGGGSISAFVGSGTLQVCGQVGLTEGISIGGELTYTFKLGCSGL